MSNQCIDYVQPFELQYQKTAKMTIRKCHKKLKVKVAINEMCVFYCYNDCYVYQGFQLHFVLQREIYGDRCFVSNLQSIFTQKLKTLCKFRSRNF